MLGLKWEQEEGFWTPLLSIQQHLGVRSLDLQVLVRDSNIDSMIDLRTVVRPSEDDALAKKKGIDHDNDDGDTSECTVSWGHHTTLCVPKNHFDDGGGNASIRSDKVSHSGR